MLVLTRKNNEQIVIGEEVTVTILEIRGNTVKLGLTAPRDVPIRRGELPATPHSSSAAGISVPRMCVIEAVMV
jgi:carbon storage regulator